MLEKENFLETRERERGRDGGREREREGRREREREREFFSLQSLTKYLAQANKHCPGK